ncbi:hypothetical protein BDP27DRAFT_1282619 [Rhodocollybia butyracea]|uniref:F-box domain-containing protein n=1 Tax=Rhodocollybia butyracea TaxID=206335 RepID=A0A9P5Q3C0_9AGAR|nr:hypothetical protein BDP27DRAFT_1282619 [Rhodocollybia butyracea]
MEFVTLSADASSSSLQILSPIGGLPAELLIEIFAFCASGDPFAPITLGTVCRFWKKAVDESPRVWQNIILDDKRSIAACQAQARLWLTRSVPLQFDVKLHVEDADNILPLLAPFLPVFHRWHQLTLTGVREENVCLSDTFSRLDILHDLSISVCDDVHGEDPFRSTFVQYSPLWPNRIAMSISLSQLPQPELMTPIRLQFTTLSITEGPIRSSHPAPAAVLGLLRSCPQLESFTLSGWMHTEIEGSHSLPVVSLPRLHTLHLRRTTLARAILSNVDVPALSKLYLVNLNVSHRITPDFFDPGDSEDEAHDYSQSPWSDQATGMGLRNLITRCNPPIKTLEMDYSDMRTKDFIYAVEKLTELEDFLIVASDLSNTVIKLLKPYDEATPISGEPEDPCLSPSPSLTIRLPYLRNLELYNCHRVSGDAIVETLMQRVKYTDRFTPKDTIQELVIADCEQFTAQHEEFLMKEMGPRFRLD